MNQNNEYAKGRRFDAQASNIETVNQTIFLKDEVVFEDLPVAAQAEVIGLDSFGRAYRSPAGAGGDVFGPVSSTDNAIARYDGTTGTLIQNSGVIIDDSNNLIATNIEALNLVQAEFVTIGLGGQLSSSGKNSFFNSSTTFQNATLDFTSATVNNFPPQYNQSLNTSDIVGFNTVTAGNLNIFKLNTNELHAFVGSQIELKSQNFRIESTNFTVLPTTNVNFNNALTIDLTNSSVDFTGSTLTGLPSGSDVSSNIGTSTQNSIALFADTTGKLITQNSDVLITGTGDIACGNLVANVEVNCEDLIAQSSIQCGGDVDFIASNTDFSSAVVDFNSATINNWPLSGGGNVSYVGLGSVLGQLAYYDDSSGEKINNSNILVNGDDDISNINDLGCNNVFSTGGVECSSMQTTLITPKSPATTILYGGVLHNFLDSVQITNSVTAGSLNTDTISGSQEIAKVGSVLVSDPNSITMETGAGTPFQVWTQGEGDNTFLGFDLSFGGGGLDNYTPNSDNQILFNKTGTGLSIYGGNNLESAGNFAISSMQELVEFQENASRFKDLSIFDAAVEIKTNSVQMDSLISNNSNTTFLTLDGGDFVRKTELIPVSGASFFMVSTGNTLFPVVNQWEFPNTLFTGKTNVQQNVTYGLTGGAINVSGLNASGLCQLSAYCSVLGTNSSNNVYEIGVFKNNVVIACTIQKFSTTNTNLSLNTGISCIETYIQGDFFDVRFRNITDIDALDIQSVSFNLHKI